MRRNLYSDMAFSSDRDFLQRDHDLKFYLTILRRYPSGMVSREEMIEALAFFERQYRLREECKPVFEILTIEDEEERLARYGRCLIVVVNTLMKSHRAEVVDAINSAG